MAGIQLGISILGISKFGISILGISGMPGMPLLPRPEKTSKSKCRGKEQSHAIACEQGRIRILQPQSISPENDCLNMDCKPDSALDGLAPTRNPTGQYRAVQQDKGV